MQITNHEIKFLIPRRCRVLHSDWSEGVLFSLLLQVHINMFVRIRNRFYSNGAFTGTSMVDDPRNLSLLNKY